MVHVMLPFLVLPLYASMRSIDGDLRARRGQSRRLADPGLLADLSAAVAAGAASPGMVLIFVLCLGFYITPAILGGGKVQMIAQRIEASVRLFPTWGPASALGVVLLVLTVAHPLVSQRADPAAGAGRWAEGGRRWKATSPMRQRLWLYVLTGLILVFLVAADPDRHPDVVLRRRTR